MYNINVAARTPTTHLWPGVYTEYWSHWKYGSPSLLGVFIILYSWGGAKKEGIHCTNERTRKNAAYPRGRRVSYSRETSAPICYIMWYIHTVFMFSIFRTGDEGHIYVLFSGDVCIKTITRVCVCVSVYVTRRPDV
jgi:hypothetical protein